jgi:hypothetical protein
VTEDQSWIPADVGDGVLPARSSGVLVIRTWSEPGHPQGFRARITYGDSSSTHHMVATSDPAEVLEVVKSWIASQPGAPSEN